jgi:hypothetical protein
MTMIRRLVCLSAILATTYAHGHCGTLTPGMPVQTTITCEPTDKTLTYLCHANGIQSGHALCDLEASIKFDMPSMSMSHSIRPVVVKLVHEGTKWEQRLDMYGEWRVRIDVAGQTTTHLLDFRSSAVVPITGR